MTLINAMMLIGVVFILTFRAGRSQQELRRLVTREAAEIARLERIITLHAAYRSQWSAAAARSPEDIARVARSYASIVQIATLTPRAASPGPHVGIVRALQSEVRDAAIRWPTLSPDDQSHVTAAIMRRCDEVVRRAAAARERADREKEARLEDLSHDPSKTMLIALGTAWIVAVISIAGARLAQRKIVMPLEDLSRAAQRLSAGDYTARAPIGGDREIAELGLAFNEMAAKIEATVDATEQRARTDELSGLPNFRAFGERIREEIDRASRYEEHFALLIFDLDHFKKYNDSYGHLAGNDALRAVSHAIRATLRTVDFPARYGGEEFAAILPQVDEEGMRVTGERVRHAVEALPPIEGRRKLTVSIGGAIFPGDGRSAEALFHAADQRLYSAKELGRNRVITPQRPKIQQLS